MKRPILWVIVAITAIVAVIAGIIVFPVDQDHSGSQHTEAITQAPVETKQAPSASETKGRYKSYTQDAVNDASYSNTIVFFHAPWCPECRAFKQAINSEEIPSDTQILEADYDSSTDLKKKYGVTLQSTFVRVDNSGELQKKWVGYGKDKSLQTVLNNVK